jgi:flagellar protein FlgJ
MPQLGNGAADVYTDFAGLTALKKGAHDNDPEALRQVAKQYESLFTRIMLKSMRDAVGKDPIFGSDEQQSYQEMYDDQLSIELSKGQGLGLADMLVRQMQRLTGGDRTEPSSTAPSGGASGPDSSQRSGKIQQTAGERLSGAARTPVASPGLPQPPTKAALRLFQDTGSAGRDAPTVCPATQASFISELWPAAQTAGQQLGVDPRNLIAQAALETNWGTRVPRDPSGRSSNNLFGMKAAGQWSGAAVSASTQEYENGTAVSATGRFRAYDSQEQSFQDYVSLLRGSPRYADAINTGSDAHAFASALQRGGYATDPHYASKIAAIAASMHTHVITQDAPLKSASARPITPSVGTL